MGWFQLPLNIWAIYATAIMQVLATPVLGITVLLLAVERFAHIGIFDPTPRRRPGAVPALLLVLLAPGRLHHDHPGHGRDQRADLDVLAQADLRLPASSRTRRSRSRCCRSSCGATTCSCRASRELANMVFSALTFTRRHPVGDQGLQLGRDALQGRHPAQDADALRAVVPLLFTIGGLTGLFLGILVGRRPPARHVLRRRALPLRHDGLDAGRVPRRPPLLVAEVHRQHVQRDARPDLRDSACSSAST